MPFSASAIFLLHLYHIGKMFLFEEFFHLGKQRNVIQERSDEYGGWDIEVLPFLVKNC